MLKPLIFYIFIYIIFEKHRDVVIWHYTLMTEKNLILFHKRDMWRHLLSSSDFRSITILLAESFRYKEPNNDFHSAVFPFYFLENLIYSTV